MPARRSLAVLAVALAVAACGSSAGGGHSVSARRYVTAVCGAVKQFKTASMVTATTLNRNPHSTPEVEKLRLISALAQLESNTHTAVSALGHAGQPDVPGGAKLATTLLSRFRGLDDALARSVTQAKALPTDNRATYQTDLLSLGRQISQAGANVGAGLPTNLAPSLQAAATQIPACQNL